MNDKRRRITWDTPTNDPSIVVSTVVWHRRDTKAYWCTITPVELDGIFRTTVCYSGVKQLLREAPRFNVNHLAEVAHFVKHDPYWDSVRTRIADTKGLVLV